MAAKPESNWGRILRGIVILLIPVVSAAAGGYGTWVFFTTSRTSAVEAEAVEWRPLGAPPGKAVKILGTYLPPPALCVETDDGGRYQYIGCPDKPGPDCWRGVEACEEASLPKGAPEVLEFTARNPPGRVVDSVVIQIPIEFSEQTTNYAVLEDGSVWVWDYTRNGLDALGWLVFSFFGAIAGFVIGIIISFAMAVRAWGWRRAITYFAIGIIILVVMGLWFVIRTSA